MIIFWKPNLNFQLRFALQLKSRAMKAKLNNYVTRCESHVMNSCICLLKLMAEECSKRNVLILDFGTSSKTLTLVLSPLNCWKLLVKLNCICE